MAKIPSRKVSTAKKKISSTKFPKAKQKGSSGKPASQTAKTPSRKVAKKATTQAVMKHAPLSVDKTKRSQLLREYLDVVDSLHGCYLDAITGLYSLVDEYDAAKAKMLASNPKIPPEAYDGAGLNYGTGHPRQPQSRVVHSCTQGEYRTRNDKGGRNHVVMGQMSLVQIFGFWEDCYRTGLATCCGKATNDLKLDIMGELRLLRISIVHHRGLALKQVESCTILNWFHEGDLIELTPQHFELIVSRIHSDLPAYIESL